MSNFNQATTENKDKRLPAIVKNEAKRKLDSPNSERLDITVVDANMQNKDVRPGIKTILISAYNAFKTGARFLRVRMNAVTVSF